MPNQIVKILLRHGTDAQRRTAEGAGVTFSLGEPAFAYDTRRMYIGDGSTSGGIPVSLRNLGSVATLFGSYASSGFSQEAYNILTLSGAEVGDIIYDRDTRVLYSLSGKSSFPPAPSDLVKYDFTVLINENQLEFNTDSQLQIKGGGVGPAQISQAVVGGGLVKYDSNSPITLANNAVENVNLAYMQPNTFKGNSTSLLTNPEDIPCGPKQFIGRTATTNLSAVNFTAILAESNIRTTNGIKFSAADVTSVTFSLCSNVFRVNESGGTVTGLNIIPSTIINGSLSAVNGITTAGNLNAYGLTTNNGAAALGAVTCGNITCGAINTQNNGINTGSASIGCYDLVATHDVNVTGNVVAGGDVIAFNSSDERLKENLTPLTNSLANIDQINGYTFTWKTSTPTLEIPRQGDDIGVIAQEIKNILPSAVSEKENGYLGVDYQRLVPFLISCIKELKTEVTQLQDEVRQISKPNTRRL